MKVELRVRQKREEKDQRRRRRGLWNELDPTKRDRKRTSRIHTPRTMRIVESNHPGSRAVAIPEMFV
jgi:hypothetical protein